jgi:hypothetical protein
MKTKQLIYFTSILIIICGLSASKVNAQDLFTAGFDTTAYHPLFIKSQNDRFKLNLGMYTQFRYNMNWRQDMPDTDSTPSYSRGYNLARTRIFLEGNFTDKFYYHTRININPSGNFEFFVAYLQWNLNKGKWIRMGRQFMALGLEDWMYPQDLASIEFSALDFTFAIWSSFGFQFHHPVSDKFRYWVGIGNGAYGGRQQFPAPNDSDLTFTGRMEYNLVGDNFGIYGDMLGRKGQPYGMMVGLGLGQLIRRDKSTLDTDAESGTQVNLDYSISGDGFRFFVQGTWQQAQFDPPEIDNQNTGGFYTTLGYWLDEHWFTYGRFDYLSKGNRDDRSDNYASPGIGISYYPFTWSNRYRFTLEYNHLGATIDDTIVQADGQLGLVPSTYGAQQHIRFQAQFGF